MTALTDPVPLRQNLAWGTFPAAGAKYLPHRYGDCSGELIQYDKQRLQFVWADHAIENIDSVLIDGAPATGWTWSNTTDVVGHPVALVTFQQPVDQGATPIARGKGKPHPRTGDRMLDPAAILWDLLANICSRDVTETQLAPFSAACAARGLTASGSIETNDQVLKIAQDICSSVGGLFAPGGPIPAFLFPVAAGISLATIDATRGHVLTSPTQLQDVVNNLTIRYGFENGAAQQSLQLDVPTSVARFGRRPLEIDAPWLANSRTAYDVAVRILQHRARARWKAHVDGMRDRVQTGQTVTLSHPVLPLGGDHIVLADQLTFSTGLCAIDLEIPAGAAPAVRIVQQSGAFDPQTYASVGVQTIGDDRILTFANNGVPYANATVTLPNGTSRQTNSAGVVKFPRASMPPGQYDLHIIAANGDEFDTSVLIQ